MSCKIIRWKYSHVDISLPLVSHNRDHLHPTEDSSFILSLVMISLPAGDDRVLVAGGVVVGGGEELASFGRLLNVSLRHHPSASSDPSHHLE